MSNNNIIYNAAAYSMALLALAGCAKRPVVTPSVPTTYSEATRVPEPPRPPEPAPKQKPKVELEAICNTAGRVLGESAIIISKDTHPFEYGVMLGALLPKYHDIDSRKYAEAEANAVAVFPTLCGYYKASIVRDVDKKGKPTGKNLIYQDKRVEEKDGQKATVKVPRFMLWESELPEKVREWLINIQKPGSKLDGNDAKISLNFDNSYDAQFARLVERIGWQASAERWHKKRDI